MKNFKTTLSIVAIAALVSISGLFGITDSFSIIGTCRAQTTMAYSVPLLTSVPPYYLGIPAAITADYILLDLAMAKSSWDNTDKFLAKMPWGDTAKYLTGMVYNVMHDNPIVFEQWAALHSWSGFGFQNDPGHALFSFEHDLSKCPDSGKTAMLVIPNLIADVFVTDTLGGIDSTALFAKDIVRASCTLLDTIKGKYVPACPDIFKADKKGAMPQNVPNPFPTYAVPAVPGTCIQFEYCLEWFRTPSPYGDVGNGSDQLSDSINGTWIKPNSEYIVFLNFESAGGNSSNVFFTMWPALQGSCAGMYPVRNGLVYDPYDDFGIGASKGLTPAIWKSRLRARIAIITGQ